MSARVVTTPLGTPDILPTLLGLTGVAVPKTIEGEDLSKVVAGSAPERDRAVLTMSVSPFIPHLVEYRAIRTNRYSYVRNLAGPWLMFDNQSDPGQTHNLADDPAASASREKLDTQLQAGLRNIGDDFQPRQYYLDKWGYTVAQHGSISYGPNAKMQTPRPSANKLPLK